MRIRFGLTLDGEHGAYRGNQLDSVTTGPLGLLGILETQLGLPCPDVLNTDRVLAFRECLKHCDRPSRFYHKTFAVDDLETSRVLLSWRDQWHLHGWSGDGLGNSSARLADMQALEELAVKSVPLSEGQRLVRVANRMDTRRHRIESVELCDPIAFFPWSWQQVLRKLPITQSPRSAPLYPSSSMLEKLQGALGKQTEGESPAKLRWVDDGSVVFVRGETTISSGSWLGSLFGGTKEDTLLVAPQGGMLSDAFRVHNLPRPDCQELSSFRPALQLLPLALSQIWTPVDFPGFIKFLTHSLCPIPFEIRMKLAETVASYPGIGGAPWLEALKKLESVWCEKGHDWTSVSEKICFWLEHARYPVYKTAPLSFVTERVRAVAEYFRVRLGEADPARRSAFLSGYSQSVACLSALKALAEQGEQNIGACKLQVLVNQCTSKGAKNPWRDAQAGSCRKISNPGAAVDPAERVVWWQLQAPTLPKPYPWSFAEQRELHAVGIYLPGITAELNREARYWQRPILAAEKQLVLVLSPVGQESHPLWLMIESLFEEGYKPRITELEKILETPDSGCRTVVQESLPERKRWWQLPADVQFSPRDKESFSSLEAFLFNPYQWVLQYHAKLVPHKLVAAEDMFQLFGNLSHTMVERYFRQQDALLFKDDILRTWFQPAFDQIVETEGAILLMPGRKSELRNYQSTLLRAMLALQKQLRAADVVKVEPEVNLSGAFVGGPLTGYADLLVTRSDGRRAIIDMKWAGGKKYPDKLAKNRHLQLALYGELVRQQLGAWPNLSYFILSQAKLLVADHDFFPRAQRIIKDAPFMDEGGPELWNRFLVTWKWRWDLLSQGRIEVAVDGEDVPAVPDGGLELEILNQKYNDYLVLAGMEVEQ